MTKERKAEILAALVAHLRKVDWYESGGLRSDLAADATGPVFRRLLWEASQVLLREDGVDFGPVRGQRFCFERKPWQKIEQRAAAQRAKGTRAHRRAEGRLRLAATQAPDTDRDRISDAADRVALRVAMRAAKG